MKISSRGFTLIELLVVIAIIGILAAATFSLISSQREKARVSAALSSLQSVNAVAIICSDSGDNLNPSPPDVAVGGVDEVCLGSVSVWPELPTGWAYVAHPDDDVSDSTFEFSATGDDVTINCTITSCITS